MESVPGAIATGSQQNVSVETAKESNPVATAPGTYLIVQP